jgi:hypothetical protein
MNNNVVDGNSNTNRLELIQVSDDIEWDSLLRRSPQYSIYLTSEFLSWTDLRDYRYLMFENGIPLIGCLLPPETIDGSYALSYCMYQGIFFIENLKDSYSDDLERTNRLSKLTSLLANLQKNFMLPLHHSIIDIRGVEWYLYDKGISAILQSRIRYTGIIRLKDFLDFEKYKKSIRRVRLQEIATNHKADRVSMNLTPDVSIFLDMYEKMFIQRGVSVSRSELLRVSAIIENGVSSGAGKLLILQENDGTPISGVFILTDGITDYYQFGASNPERLKMNGSSYLILHAIEMAFLNGRNYFDMVGMNSPNRGDYKASFNARVTPYFEVEFRQVIVGK